MSTTSLKLDLSALNVPAPSEDERPADLPRYTRLLLERAESAAATAMLLVPTASSTMPSRPATARSGLGSSGPFSARSQGPLAASSSDLRASSRLGSARQSVRSLDAGLARVPVDPTRTMTLVKADWTAAVELLEEDQEDQLRERGCTWYQVEIDADTHSLDTAKRLARLQRGAPDKSTLRRMTVANAVWKRQRGVGLDAGTLAFGSLVHFRLTLVNSSRRRMTRVFIDLDGLPIGEIKYRPQQLNHGLSRVIVLTLRCDTVGEWSGALVARSRIISPQGKETDGGSIRVPIYARVRRSRQDALAPAAHSAEAQVAALAHKGQEARPMTARRHVPQPPPAGTRKVSASRPAPGRETFLTATGEDEDEDENGQVNLG